HCNHGVILRRQLTATLPKSIRCQHCKKKASCCHFIFVPNFSSTCGDGITKAFSELECLVKQTASSLPFCIILYLAAFLSKYDVDTKLRLLNKHYKRWIDEYYHPAANQPRLVFQNPAGEPESEIEHISEVDE